MLWVSSNGPRGGLVGRPGSELDDGGTGDRPGSADGFGPGCRPRDGPDCEPACVSEGDLIWSDLLDLLDHLLLELLVDLLVDLFLDLLIPV